MITYADDRVGKTIYADDIKLLKVKHRRTPSFSAQRAEAKLVNVDYTDLLSEIARLESDNIIKPQEKKVLKLQWDNLNALRLNTLAQAERFGIEHQELFLSYIDAYEELDTLMSLILGDMNTDTDITEYNLTNLFDVYYQKAVLVDEQLFRLETGLISGLDYRVKLEVNIHDEQKAFEIIDHYLAEKEN